MALSFVKVVLPAFFGTSSAIVGGLHLGTVETFESYLKKHCIPKEINSGDKSPWEKAEEKIKDQSDESDIYPPFKGLKSKIEKDNNSKGKILRDVCKEVYSWIYSSFIVNNKYLLSSIKKYCFTDIQSMMEDGKKYSEKSQLKDKVENKISKKENTISNFEFERIKNSTNKNSEEENFYKECERLYKSPYLGTEDDNWKVVQAYCLKEDS